VRVTDFWGGVYKKFLVRGPDKYLFKLERNGSWSTIMSGVFVDKITGPRTHFDTLPMSGIGTRYEAPRVDVDLVQPNTEDATTAFRLWRMIDSATDQRRSGLLAPYRLMAYRVMQESEASDDLLANWKWRLSLWDQEQRDEFARAMAEGHRRIREINEAQRRPKKEAD
jgi:hypothetical protein